MSNARPDLTPNDLESIRQAASDRGDCDTSSLANVAMWGAGRARTSARRKLARTIALLLAVTCAACTTTDPTLTAARETIAAECGPPPLAPGWAAAFDGDTVTLSRADMARIAAWRADVAAFASCVQVDEVAQ